MAAFEYEALDGGGRRTRGLVSADCEAAARKQLRRRRLAPLSVRRANDTARPGLLNHIIAPKALSQKDRASVTRQLATLIDAGMPVAEAVALVGVQTRNSPVGRIMMDVREKVVAGERLSEAMTAYPGSFPAVYRAMVAAGESTGGLGQVLERLADYLETSSALKRRIGAALAYPGVLAVVALIVIIVLLTLIVPQIAEQFTAMNMTLPWITRTMIDLSGFLQAHGVILLAALVGLGPAWVMLSRRKSVRRALDMFRLCMPGLGAFSRQVEAARYARTMAILIKAGVVLPEALRWSRHASASPIFQERMSELIDQVETGKGLADAIRDARWFSDLMVYMVATGERTDRLAEMFDRVADHLEAEIGGTISVGLGLVEPGIILVMAGVVVMIILSILLPILQLNTAVLL